MNEDVFMRVLIKAPCVTSRDGKRFAPMVDCDFDCNNCDWNPREHQRRMTEGQFINGKLHFKRR